MGTRADFWTRDKGKLTWLGSIGWDGYPDGIDDSLLDSESLPQFKKEVKAFLNGRMKVCDVCKGSKIDPTGKNSFCFDCPSQDATFPNEGWPWPWTTSETTDYAYVFDKTTNQLLIAGFGGDAYTIAEERKYDKYQKRIEKYNKTCEALMQKEELDQDEWLKKHGKCDIVLKFPEMKIVKENIFHPKKSGIMLIGSK